MKSKRNLAQVSDPAGRVDVAAYRTAERLLERWERHSGLAGLRENFLPIIEQAILGCDLPAYEIPPEVRAIINFLEQNRRAL